MTTVSESYRASCPASALMSVEIIVEECAFHRDERHPINITLTGVGGAFVPATVMLGLGLGQPSGTDCVTSTSVNTAAGGTAQVTGTFDPAVYCAKVSDIGNLFAPASFSVSIAYP